MKGPVSRLGGQFLKAKWLLKISVGFLLSSLCLGTVASAADMYPSTTASAILARNGKFGGELAAGLTFQPIEYRAFFLGPRLSYLFADFENGQTRNEWNIGMEGMLWFFNLIGPGFAIDYVAISSPLETRLRFEPFFSARLFRHQDYGAWAVRVGSLYDPEVGFQTRVGVSLQWSGVAAPFLAATETE